MVYYHVAPQQQIKTTDHTTQATTPAIIPFPPQLTFIGLNCPNLWILSYAYYSTAGFHQGSISITCEAHVRLRATPPAFSDMRNSGTSGSLVNRAIIRLRMSMVMLPSKRTLWMPTWWPTLEMVV